MTDEMTLKSGNTVTLGMASFADGMRLFKVLVSELKLVDIDLTSLADVGALAGKDINSIKNVLLQVLGSEALEQAVFKCAERSLYNGQRITRTSFEDEQARGDFFEVAWEVMRFNLSPFFKNLDWKSWIAPRQVASPPP